MDVGIFRISYVFYDAAKNVRIPFGHTFTDETEVWSLVEWLKDQDKIVTLEVKVGKPYGEEYLLVWN